jgi:predicted N-acetyltransferase YhbS
MQIRKLHISDIDQLAVLYSEFWGEESSVPKMKEVYSRMEKDSGYLILVAIENEKVIGSIYGAVCQELYGDCKPFLVMEDFIVNPSERRKGIGRALLFEMEKFAKESNCSQIIFITENDRKDTVRFYQSIGYNPFVHTGFKKSL